MQPHLLNDPLEIVISVVFDDDTALFWSMFNRHPRAEAAGPAGQGQRFAG